MDVIVELDHTADVVVGGDSDIIVALDRAADVVIDVDNELTVVIERTVTIGVASAGGDTGFTMVQASGSATWTVNHNLGFRPDVSVLTPGGSEMIAEVVHISINQLRVYFSAPKTGSVRCI